MFSPSLILYFRRSRSAAGFMKQLGKTTKSLMQRTPRSAMVAKGAKKTVETAMKSVNNAPPPSHDSGSRPIFPLLNLTGKPLATTPVSPAPTCTLGARIAPPATTEGVHGAVSRPSAPPYPPVVRTRHRVKGALGDEGGKILMTNRYNRQGVLMVKVLKPAKGRKRPIVPKRTAKAVNAAETSESSRSKPASVETAGPRPAAETDLPILFSTGAVRPSTQPRRPSPVAAMHARQPKQQATSPAMKAPSPSTADPDWRTLYRNAVAQSASPDIATIPVVADNVKQWFASGPKPRRPVKSSGKKANELFLDFLRSPPSSSGSVRGINAPQTPSPAAVAASKPTLRRSAPRRAVAASEARPSPSPSPSSSPVVRTTPTVDSTVVLSSSPTTARSRTVNPATLHPSSSTASGSLVVPRTSVMADEKGTAMGRGVTEVTGKGTVAGRKVAGGTVERKERKLAPGIVAAIKGETQTSEVKAEKPTTPVVATPTPTPNPSPLDFAPPPPSPPPIVNSSLAAAISPSSIATAPSLAYYPSLANSKRPAWACTPFALDDACLFDVEGGHVWTQASSLARRAHLTSTRYWQNTHPGRTRQLNTVTGQYVVLTPGELATKRTLEDRAFADKKEKRWEIGLAGIVNQQNDLINNVKSLNAQVLSLPPDAWTTHLESRVRALETQLDAPLRARAGLALAVERSPSTLSDFANLYGQVPLFPDAPACTNVVWLDQKTYLDSYRFRTATRGGVEVLERVVERRQEEIQTWLWRVSAAVLTRDRKA